MLVDSNILKLSDPPGIAGGLVLLAPQRGKNMKRLKALISHLKFELVISLIFLFLMPDVCSHHLFVQSYR